MNRWTKIAGIIVITILIALPVCYQAAKNRLFIFDEGYYFIQAYELGEHGRFFIDFDPSVKLKNTKPYLFSFAQTLLGKTICWNEWAIRIPTIGAAVALIWMLFLFIKKTFQDTLWACCAATILLVLPYFIHPHMAFTGDHDVPLLLFTTAFIFLFYLFLIAKDHKQEKKYIIGMCVAATASVLTKGWMIVFFLPFCFIFLFIYKKQNALIQHRTFWISIVLSVLVLAAWYLGREYITPGYLDAVWTYEIGRYNNGLQNIHPEFSYYWLMLVFEQVQGWLLALPVVLYMMLMDKTITYKAFLNYILVVIIGFLCLLSFSQVKLLWYDAPVFPLLAVVLGAGVAHAIRQVSEWMCKGKTWCVVALYLLVFLFFYVQLFNRNFSHAPSEAYGNFMMTKHTNESYTIAHTKYNPHLLFYKQYAEAAFTVKHPVTSVHTVFGNGQKILICEPLVMLQINRKYEYTVLDSLHTCKLIQIRKSR